MAIATRTDSRRGCGWRKPGGLYLVANGPSSPCGKFPIPLSICPTCNCGIKPTRGWTWVDGDALAKQTTCRFGLDFPFSLDYGTCPMSRPLGRVGLLWVGGAYYKTPADWTNEAVAQGVSRRVKALPKGFVLGETWVFVAHREAIQVEPGLGSDTVKFAAGVFHAFKPTAVEYIVKGDETEEQIAAMEKRGITPVRIERVEEQPELVAEEVLL